MYPPNFLILGAARSGTTALARFLEQHPDVSLTNPKEPHFLAFESQAMNFAGPGDNVMINDVTITDADNYRALFDNHNTKVRGEGSVSSLYYHERSVPAIQRIAPQAKMLIVLRNPIFRAYSSFLYTTSRTFESLESFGEALDAESQRISDNWHHMWHYTSMGFYHKQVSAFLEAFSGNQVKVVLADDFRSEPTEVLKDIFQFLEVDDSFRPSTEEQINRSGNPRNAFFHTCSNFFNSNQRFKSVVKAVLPPRAREKLRNMALSRPEIPMVELDRLRQLFANEIHDLAGLLGRDLDHWLTQVSE